MCKSLHVDMEFLTIKYGHLYVDKQVFNILEEDTAEYYQLKNA